MLSENLLMIFIKNPVLGKVKTRLAENLGSEKALQVYQKLLAHTHRMTNLVQVNKAVFYSDYISKDDVWQLDKFQQFMQKGNDLGEKMSSAFIKAFEMGYRNVVIIGSDCFELTEDIVTEAFHILQENEVVIGPAEDGGYYLLGMRRHHRQLFDNKKWSTDHVLNDTLFDLAYLNLTYQLLPILSDIDDEKDLINYLNKKES